MPKPSFADLKQELEDAFASLRTFTLGHRGATQRGGVAGVQLVSDLCDRLKERFASGPHAGDMALAVASGRMRVRAAEVRLALLRGKR